MDSFPELKNLYLNPTMSDITLIVDGIKIPAHKLILSAKSEVFMAMFCGDMIEKTAQEIEIKETSVEAFYLMLKYVYTEKFALNDVNDYEMAINVFKIAHRFRFERLIHIIKQLITQMVEKSNDWNRSPFLSLRSNFKESDLEVIKNLMIDSSISATFDNMVSIYEFANLYEIDDLIIACNRFLQQPRNAFIFIDRKSFICESLETMFELLEMIGKSVSQTTVINALQSIRELKPDSDLKPFESLINLNNCSMDDINKLRNIKLFSEDILFNAISRKFNQLICDNQMKSMKIIEQNLRIQDLNEENKDLLLEKNSLYDNYFRLKQVFAPFMRGETNLWVNEYSYLRNYSRTRPKSTSTVNFKF